MKPRFNAYGDLPYTWIWRRDIVRQAARTKQKKTPLHGGKVYRFDARLNEEQKLLIQRAADLDGRTMTDFVLRSAEVAAERTIRERAMLVLTAREIETFVSSILNPPEPGPVLRKAARQYKRLMGHK